MFQSTRRKEIIVKMRIFAPALTLAAALSLAACSGGSPDETSDTPAAPEETTSGEMSDEPTADMTEDAGGATDAQFGPACADVPSTGAGSFEGMAQDPVATAASNNPALSTLVDLVGLAELGDTLNGAEDITVFAPANSAFEALPPEAVEAVKDDPSGLLTDVLTYHVIPQTLTPQDLAGTFETLNGAELTIEGSDEDFSVGADGASIVCGNIQTANATVYIIDGVLMPPSQ